MRSFELLSRRLHKRFSSHGAPGGVERFWRGAKIVMVPLSSTNDGATSQNKPRIMVIDDDPLFRSLLVSILRKEYSVVVASDGAEGLYRALEGPPVIAVVDIQMPGWDGLTTLKAFRSHPQLSHVRIVMLTSDSSKETILAAVAAGADDYIIKTSFARKEFLDKLARQVMFQGEHATVAAPWKQSTLDSHMSAPVAVVNRPHTASVSIDEQRLRAAIDSWE